MKKILLPFMVIVAVVLSFLVKDINLNNLLLKKLDKKEKKALKKPNDWLGRRLIYPTGKLNTKAYHIEMKKAAQMHMQATSRHEWESVGPTNIGGRITDIEIDPTDNSTLYIAAASGGIFKTTNAGNTWENIFTQAPVISIGDIAIDPNNNQTIYAGTGEANSSSFSFLGNGIYKTTDGGINWQNIGLENSGYIGRIIVDYSNPNRVFVASLGYLFEPNEDRGIYRSLDGGISWERTLFVSDSTSAIDLVQDSQNPDILYAAMWEKMRGLEYRRSGGPSSGVYKSTDGGATWTELTNGLPNGDDKGRIGLAISKSNPQVIYASYDSAPFGGSEHFMGVYKTTNGGATWAETNSSSMHELNSSFGWYFGQIRVDPVDENRAYTFGVEFWKTDNGGSEWNYLAGYGEMDQIHVDYHALAFDEQTNRIYVGNDGGLYYSDNYGNSWSKINNLPITQFYDIDIDNNHPERIYGGTQDNNSIRTYNGSSSNWEATLGGDGFYSLVSPMNSDIYYAEYQWGNLYRFDPYNSWGEYIKPSESDRTNWSAPYDLFATSSNTNGITMYFGTYRVWKSTNGGSSWNAVSDDLTKGDSGNSGYHTLSTLAISPIDHNKIMTGSDDGLVYISTDAGSNWQNITEGLPDRWITRVAFDPIEDNTIYVTISGFRWNESLPHIYKSTDLGITWNSISSDMPEIPINCIALDPQDNNRIFVGTDSGIFMTTNGGTAWESASNGIPNVPIADIKIHNDSRTMVIGTYGCSAYKINLDSGFVSNTPNNITEASLMLKQSYPNPFRLNDFAKASLKISYNLPKNGHVNLKIYNMKGQLVKTLINDFKDKGEHTAVWNGKDKFGKKIASGIYLYKLTPNHGIPIVKKLTIVK